MELANYYHSDDPSRKHIKLGEGGGKHNPIDFISDLPDSLILHILSFLHARDAIRTTTLSRRWQDLWMDNLTLNFKLYQLIGEDYYMDPELGPGRFISFVNCTLLFHRSPKIDKMVVEMCYEKSFANDINAWILFAMKKSVNELQLHFPIPDDDYGEDMKPVLPCYMFNGPCLVTLKITHCSFEGYRLLNWKSLRNLSLSSVVLNNNMIRDILSGSPVLESMALTSCVDFDYIHIESKNLAKLVIKNYKSNANGLKISAPYLQSLLITGGFNGHSVSLINTSASLVDVTIAYSLIYTVADFERSHEMFSKSVRQLVEKLRHVKNLTIGRSCFQLVLSMILLENAQPFPFSNLVCLQIHLSLRQAELPTFFRLLTLTPILDTLLLYMTPISPCPMVENWWSRTSRDVTSQSFWAPRRSLLAATFLNIKIVTILNFGGSKMEMKLIAVFLKHARGLVNMIIQSTNVFYPWLQESLHSIVTQSEVVWTFAPSKRLPYTVILSRGQP